MQSAESPRSSRAVSPRTPRHPLSSRGTVILETHTVLTTPGSPRLLSRDVRVIDPCVGFMPRYSAAPYSGRVPAVANQPMVARAAPSFDPKGRPVPAGSWRSTGPLHVASEYSRAYRYQDPVGASAPDPDAKSSEACTPPSSSCFSRLLVCLCGAWQTPSRDMGAVGLKTEIWAGTYAAAEQSACLARACPPNAAAANSSLVLTTQCSLRSQGAGSLELYERSYYWAWACT